MTPRFTHDCDGCKFLGQDEAHDFYFCPSSMPTVIARYGNDGPEYTSGLEIARQIRALLDFEYPLSKALTLAEEQGFLKRPEAVEADPEDGNRLLLHIDSSLLNAKIVPRPAFSKDAAYQLQERIRAELGGRFVGMRNTPQTMEVVKAHIMAFLKELLERLELKN